MASNNFLVVFLLMMFISSTIPKEIHAINQDLVTATKEMQKANYFTFVMLINMSPIDTRLEGNVTFLMPNDRMLANMVLQEGEVSRFLLRHSIPSSLLFHVLEQFPNGTTIPSSLPNYMLRISNNGRRNFVINNVKIISPNICVAGSSIRCHGIDGVLSEGNYNNTEPSSNAMPPIPSPLSPSGAPTITPLIAPSPIPGNSGPQISWASRGLSYASMKIVAYLMLSLVWIYF